MLFLFISFPRQDCMCCMDFVSNGNLIKFNRQMKHQKQNARNSIEWVRFGVQSKVFVKETQKTIPNLQNTIKWGREKEMVVDKIMCMYLICVPIQSNDNCLKLPSVPKISLSVFGLPGRNFSLTRCVSSSL